MDSSYLNENFSLQELLQKEIPQNLHALAENAANLEKLAVYCENQYLGGKPGSFHETKQFTVQSLAGVAYNVGLIASNMMRCLALEERSISSKTNDVTNTGLDLAVRKEKGARQEIGKLTLNKQVLRFNKITYPNKRLKPPRHQFSEIDFFVLNNVGHGLQTVRAANVNRTNSILSGSDTVSSHGGSAPYDYLIRDNATLTRKSMRPELYRAQVPQVNYADAQRYSTVTSRSGLMSDYGSIHYSQSSTVRASILPSQNSQFRHSVDSNDAFPPPPQSLAHPNDEPLPPPPPAFNAYWGSTESTLPTPDWVPANYIEKAIAIYSYDAEKPDELNLRENCIVYVVAKNDDGWYEGVMDGMTGLFPSNYVEKIE